MASKPIADMTDQYAPERYTHRFADAIRALAEQHAAAGKTERVQPMEEAASTRGFSAFGSYRIGFGALILISSAAGRLSWPA